ncbi:hypothetical protein Glove_120g81 [Diversispora epigaea]|uniref:Uncharacterized protein n=1 Tax=Diversispora epigaea TaxID=1348612 RepID=A0A397J2B0_9GLOM|nr:hypothetical protein Glove_120g81 [Diversispora epigaea]
METKESESYTYDIIKEGLYPLPSYLIYTKGLNWYWVPDNYEVKSSWGKLKNQQIIKCTIKYQEKKPGYIMALNTKKNPRYSGPHLFELHLEILQQIRDNCQRATVLKLFNCLTTRGQNNRSKQIAKSVYSSFNQIVVVQVCDKNQIIHNGYKTLTSINQDLPHIPLSDDINSEVHINDIEIINNVQELIWKRWTKYLVEKKILNVLKPKIYLRISGNGRNVGRKINHVMVTFSILNDIENIFRPENHHTILLYPGIEK